VLSLYRALFPLRTTYCVTDLTPSPAPNGSTLVGPVMFRLSVRHLKRKALENCIWVGVRPPPDLKDIPGYLHPLECRFLYWLANRVSAGGVALEVGSFKGKSSANIAAGLSAGSRLVCVDTWMNDAMPYDSNADVFSEFEQNVRQYADRIDTHRNTSVTVSESWNQPIDLLFIDGDHSYEGCSSDLESWMPFVRPGGYVALHDSAERGVVKAIEELFPEHQRTSEMNVWSIFAARKKRYDARQTTRRLGVCADL